MITDQSVEQFQKGWVGRSKVSSTFFNKRSGELETINIGSRSSAVYLRIYDKVAQAISEGDIEYWWDVWDGYLGSVTRVEWEVKPNKGGFEDIEDFRKLCGLRIIELLNYLIIWGRLCVPDQRDSNNRRWKLSKFWAKVTENAKEWGEGITWPTSRKGKEFKGKSEGYLRFVAGTISGAMARLCPQKPSLFQMLDIMEEYGLGLEKIQRDAEAKAEIITRL